MKRAYYFFFYKFYQFGEWSPSIFPSDFTATIAISCLELFFLMSLKVYYFDFIDQSVKFKPLSFQLVFSIIVVLSINIYLFIINERWKSYVKAFNKLPRKADILGSLMVGFIVTFVCFNFVYSIYRMSQITGSH
nr:hypothetical protein [Mucilaginibacter sp. FT3.2]